jgi:outer membrane lipase/esterase
VVYGGSNDLLDIFDLALANPTYDPIPAVESTVASIFGILDQLATADAKSILVPNVANLGLVPLITQGGAPVDEATMLSLLFNTGLSTAVDDLATLYPDTRFFEFDVFGLFTDAYLNPTDYGFSNVSDACYSLFVEAGGTTCSSPDEFISWDGLHPTTAAHEIFAANVVVPIPAALWLFGSGLLGLLVVVRRRS